ncbi:MAG TPA: ABC transporter permease, partial [Thermoanaerobaculia bacterium]|nr:ABC transporter permease [Thermoanaerobaculia bacterium]
MTVFTDLRRAGRALARRPALAVTAAGTLALGVAAVALALAFRHAVLVAPVSFPEPEQLVDVLASRQGVDSRFSLYEADFVAYAEASDSFVALGAYEPVGRRALTGAGEPRQLSVHRVTHGLLAALGVAPLHGRALGPGDEAPGAPAVVLLSEHLWRDAFAADPAVVGRDVVLDGTPHAVVGVLPGGFGVRGGYPDAWLPLPLTATAPRSGATFGAIGRLAPGVSLTAARAEAEAVALRLAATDPEAFEDRRFSLEPLVEVMTASMRPPARLLAVAALLLLVLAATNGSALLLARTAERDREMAVRSSLGAGVAGRVRPVAAEAFWLVLGGCAGGLAMAALLLPLLPDLHGRFLYRSIDLALARPVVLGALAAALAAGLVAALPAVARAAVAGRGGALANLRGGSAPRGSQRLGSALVVAQLALACVLLAGAAALLVSLGRLVAEDLGFEPRGVLAFEVTPPPSRYAGADELA